MMELLILGSGTCVPSKRRNPSGYLIRIHDEILLFDSGSGTLGRIAAVGINFSQIDFLFYTHLHLDHIADLLPFLFAMKNTPGIERKTPLYLHGPPGFIAFFQNISQIFGHSIQSNNYKTVLRELSSDVIQKPNWSVSTKRVLHGQVSIGYRIEKRDGGSIVYSGDTDYCPEIIELASGCDILVLECSYPDGLKVPGHLTPSFAGRIAKECGCNRLVLTHLYPPCDEVDIAAQCAKHFNGEIIVAEDLMRLKVG